MSRTSLAAVVLSLALPLMAACNGGAPTYAEDHDSEVRFDCEETVACLMSKGDSLSANPVNDCIHESAARLNSNGDKKRALFETTFARCSQFRGCEYYACTQADGSYSTSHANEIRQHCTQTVACQMAQGQAVAVNATDACVMQVAMTLDAQTPEMRAVFETRFMRCATLQACMYSACQ